MADNNKAMSLENTKRYLKGILQGWFTNKATLDKFSEGQSGELLYDGDPIGSGGGGTNITVDAVLSPTSENPVQNKAIYEALQNVSGGTPMIVDSILDNTSENPVQNKVVKAALDEKANISDMPDVSIFAQAASVYTKTEVDELISNITVCGDVPMSDVDDMLDSVFGSGGLPSVKIVSFANGTDEEIANMLSAHYAGQINIRDFWRVGDTRKISLSAMEATGVGESHVAQDVDIVLVNPGGYVMEDGTECAFVWQQKDGLAEPGYINPTETNANGWDGSARRTWCSSVYKQALPESFRSMLKQCSITSANVNSIEEIFLPSMTEVYGIITDQNNITWTNGYEGEQWDYYKTESNIHNKKMGTTENSGNIRLFYWLRSADGSNTTSFMRVPVFQGVPKGSQANSVTVDSGQYIYHYAIVPCGFI